MIREAVAVAFTVALLGVPAGALGQGERREAVGSLEPPASEASEGSRFAERSGERDALVDRFIRGRGISDPKVLRAMHTVPRHLFVPERLARSAYHDTALPIGYGQTISQPYVVAYMTEVLALSPGDKVLEVGSGSGYQAAVLAEIVEEVYSIEIVPQLAAEVRERLSLLGYGGIHLKGADGYDGWEEEAPFDKMIVTAAVDHLPPPLLRQLAPGGRLILPLGPPGGIQTLLLVSKGLDGSLQRTSLLSVRFVPMTGRALE